MKSRKWFITAIAVFSLGLVSVPSGAAVMMKVGVVDLQKALNATSEGIAAKERLREKHEGKQGQVEAMKAELDTLEEKIKSPVVSEKALADLKEEYSRKRTQLLQFVASAKEEEERENQQLSSRILEGLVEIAQGIAKEEEFTLILEKSGSGVIYFEEGMDLTDRVIKIYNERFQGEKTP
ncbi:MAG: OmpH family outer membrane protein [Proteobacteria bacterium]|nr:OmpH family outer membrane protein [Pseudomonadota bacterium]